MYCRVLLTLDSSSGSYVLNKSLSRESRIFYNSFTLLSLFKNSILPERLTFLSFESWGTSSSRAVVEGDKAVGVCIGVAVAVLVGVISSSRSISTRSINNRSRWSSRCDCSCSNKCGTRSSTSRNITISRSRSWHCGRRSHCSLSGF